MEATATGTAKTLRARRKYSLDQCDYEPPDKMKKESDSALYFQQFVATFFALVINILDGCTFGLIIFPPDFSVTYNTLGVSLFLYSTVIVQAVFTAKSEFTIGLGTAMAENIPFLHSMAISIKAIMAEDGVVDEVSLVSTTIVCYCISTLVNGICFYAVGYYKAGQLLHYFPHHIIVGVIGGFGFFLLTTALEISTAIPFSWDISTLESYLDRSVLFHWVVVFGLGVTLRLMQWRWPTSQFIAPAFMLAVPCLFYVGLVITGTSIEEAQQMNWLFQKVIGTHSHPNSRVCTYERAHPHSRLPLLFSCLSCRLTPTSTDAISQRLLRVLEASRGQLDVGWYALDSLEGNLGTSPTDPVAGWLHAHYGAPACTITHSHVRGGGGLRQRDEGARHR
jgi:hypothetical protein